MIDYYVQPPFFASTALQAISAVADLVNSNKPHAVAQAPHHFELWQIGGVNEQTGQIYEEREFLGDCNIFVRSDIRKGTDGGTSDVPPAARNPRPGREEPRGNASAPNGTRQDHPQGQAGTGP